jgi:hypothetical protein
MVLVMARQVAGPRKRWQRCSKGELENNSRKPMDPTKNRHRESLKKGQFTLSQGKMKKRDDDVDDDDDVVRTIVSQDIVTATLCTEELFLRTHYI